MRSLLYCFLCLLALSFTACQDVITLDLDEAAQQTVVEANILTDLQRAEVRLSKSGTFYQSNDFEQVNGANINLYINGQNYSFQSDNNGYYWADSIQIQAGDSAFISINLADGRQIAAAAACPNPVLLDSLSYEEFVFPFGGQIGYRLYYHFQDPADTANFYRTKVWTNNELEDNYILIEDELRDGDYLDLPFFGPPFEAEDSIQLQLLSVNKAYYDYFEQIAEVGESGASASVPYNPKGNWDDPSILGYFGIIHRHQLQIQMPQ
ncbi:DUF4249 domain-containing protein [Saprospira sp. CCB-QB6]|uniref:DUF4249 domain-containing protein n=1 Tax=Saprospira sp. CCB-QB6 TaxID=3023936 RepID=UPI0023491B95|nr:DUF4249 domain-containing protein [Saprospira sp. CCB-QB6]WCL81562.1 DUF4249 domain-containing protein [Saprospira sp. CCB-QB6]